MKIRSIKQELVVRMATILITFIAVFTVAFVYQTVKSNQARLKQKKETFLQNLKAKGRLLVNDKARTLQLYVADNSIGAMSEVVTETVQSDEDIVYGHYVNLENYQPWVWATTDNPDGHISDDRNEAGNPSVVWAGSLDQAGLREVKSQPNTIYEFASPIYLSMDDDLLGDDLGGDVKAGVIIFGLSTKHINEAVAAENEAMDRNLRRSIFFLMVVAASMFALGYWLTWRQAGTITQPLLSLTTSAGEIARGNYNAEVQVHTKNEIQTLARSFNGMARDLQASYADLRNKNKMLREAQLELEGFNKQLERMVSERTKQLAESESKFRALFEESADAIAVSNEHRFVDCNHAMLTLFGCRSKEEFLALHPDEISPDHQPDGIHSSAKLREIHRDARIGGSHMFEWVHRRLDGREFPAEIVITSFPLNGERVFHKVFRDITERRETERALHRAQQQLVEAAHSAGMNEMATGVLHNIGNILNSVNISTEEIGEILKATVPNVQGLVRVNELLQEHKKHLGHYLGQDERGSLIPSYLATLGETLQDEMEAFEEEIHSLVDKVSVMRDVISTQQNYAKSSHYADNVDIKAMVEDALKLHYGTLRQQGVEVFRKYQDEPVGNVPKVKLIHVLTNLIKNAQEAMIDNPRHSKPQTLELHIERLDGNQVEIRVMDNGCGIKNENRDKIFNHGFTTKPQGHGFGLHTCANFMTEMGGSLTASSPGEEQGAIFVLRFPLAVEEVRAAV